MHDGSGRKFLRLRLGFGARVCIVLTGGLLLWNVWVYQSNFEYWQEYEHCSQLPEPPLRPIGFNVVEAKGLPLSPTQGNQRYKICFQNPPIAPSRDTPVNCALLLPKEDKELSPVIIEGPANASAKTIEEAANRLGLNGDLLKLLADGGARTEIADRRVKADYESCAKQYYVSPVKKPTIDYNSVLFSFAWIWGIYGIVRFLRGK